jgi:hypothetical protein
VIAFPPSLGVEKEMSMVSLLAETAAYNVGVSGIVYGVMLEVKNDDEYPSEFCALT